MKYEDLPDGDEYYREHGRHPYGTWFRETDLTNVHWGIEDALGYRPEKVATYINKVGKVYTETEIFRHERRFWMSHDLANEPDPEEPTPMPTSIRSWEKAMAYAETILKLEQ